MDEAVTTERIATRCDAPPAEAEVMREYSNSRLHEAFAYSTFSSDGVKKLVAPYYNLRQPITCILLHRGHNDTYLLADRQRRFALRISRTKQRSQEALLSELTVLHHLSGRGLEVATPVPRANGDWITEIQAPEGLRRAVLFEWMPGHNPSYTNEAHCFRYGELVGTLHCVSEDLPADPVRPVIDLRYLLEGPIECICEKLGAHPQIKKSLEALAARVVQRLNQAELSTLDWGFCHGDVWAGNAQIDDDRLVLIDFECCGTGWRAFDLATYRWEARRQGAERIAWPPFLEGYLRVRPQAVKSVAAIPSFMILRHLWNTAQWIAMTVDMGMSILPGNYLEDLVPFCEKIEAEGLG